ncbi:flagellar motor protein MotB [Halobacteriovorax sp. ZH4_bin.1]|uniref:OmpA/MotB family protein n=1 Tax=unclassified Halobacteriovorax TaxID=2639665 RepID=UPI003720E0E4
MRKADNKGRRGKIFEDAPDEGEAWLLSYADMMTLIACFFILMMAFANYDPAGFKVKAEIVAKSFSKGKVAVTNEKFKEINEEIAKHPELLKISKITVNDSKMRIEMSGSILFPQNEVSMSEEMTFLLDNLIDIIKSKGEDDYRIIIEGHSDNLPIKQNSKYRNHWSLAAARAALVIERFEYFGFSPKNLKMISLGDSEPLRPNQDKNGKPISENNKINRRVVIKVIEIPKFQKKLKMGLGVLFED